MKILSLSILFLACPFIGLQNATATNVTEEIDTTDDSYNVDIGEFTITPYTYAGFTFKYKDTSSNTAGTSLWMAHRPSHEWIFQHAGSSSTNDRLVMKLDSSHQLLLYKNASNTSTPSVTLNPDGVSSFTDSVTLNGPSNLMTAQSYNGPFSILNAALGDGRYMPKGTNNIGGLNSFVGGINSEAGENSVAIGNLAESSGHDSVALGHATVAPNASHSVAIGSYANVVSLGSVITLAATAIGPSTASGSYTLASGVSTASGAYSSAFGQSVAENWHSTAGGGSHATGEKSTAFGSSVATGGASTASGAAVSSGWYSAAFGNGQSQGHWSNAFGASLTFSDASIDGRFATASGQSTAKALWATALGNSVASGMGATSLGYAFASGIGATSGGFASATGVYSTTFGCANTSSGDFSVSFGRDVIANGYAQIVIGQANVPSASTTGSATTWVPTDELFVIGNGTSAAARSNALVVKKNGDATFQGVVHVAPGGDIPMFVATP